ncbi:uncharacterized protein LOC116775248 isoform X1 [Danaus plexippus]|uniref:uncharacterized protein LOC116775248 isoform X1 n=1 Tax=Danaus plexippus TaxID=13037 RepID=UPI002AB28F3C|nr:uncharacterized protein LOC116775248 isoform X1 [Danaus plexippus]
MAWLWLFSYIFIVVMILKINNALDLATFSKFVENFHKLVEEMSIYFEPCGFPIELVERCQRDSQYAQQEIVRLTETFHGFTVRVPSPSRCWERSCNSSWDLRPRFKGII